jgi:ParB/Sulfiredoxin domain
MARKTRADTAPTIDHDAVNARLAEISGLVLPTGLQLLLVPIAALREQDINAQSMPQTMFDQLVENIRQTGALESIPLCVRVGDHIEIISGHHRIRAARAAGVAQVLVLLYTDLSRSRVRSKQLAHNSIVGASDVQLVKRIWAEIADVQARFEAFIDPRTFDDVPKPVQFKAIDLALDGRAQTVLIVFLASQKDDFDAAIQAITKQAGEADAIYLAHKDDFDAWYAALRKVRETCAIASIPTAIAEMARLAMEALDTRAAGSSQTNDPA